MFIHDLPSHGETLLISRTYPTVLNRFFDEDPVQFYPLSQLIDHFAGGDAAYGVKVKRIIRSAVFLLATVYFIVDAVFLTIATPLARWMARQKVFVRLRKWIGSLRPYPSLALLAVPLIVLEPVKPVAAYLIATGQIAAGVTVLVIGEILKLVIVERLFKLCRRKLLKIPLFAWGYGHWRQGVDWIVSMSAWQAARRRMLLLRSLFRNFIIRLKRSSRHRRLFAQSR